MSAKTFPLRLANLLALALFSLLAGCGSGSGESVTTTPTRTGQLQLHIVWPQKTTGAANGRYIPSYASSLFFEIYLTSNPTKRYDLIVNRPSDKPSTQTVTFNQILNEGNYTLAGAARIGADGQGATVASASVPVTVKQGMNAVDLALNSTIKTIQVLGQPLTATVGTAVTLQSGAFDPDGNTLLLPSGALTWSLVSGSELATLTSAGLLTPTAAGTVRVKLAESNTGVTAQADITISTQMVTTSLGATPYPKEYADLLNTGGVAGNGSSGRLAWTYDLGASTNYYTTSPILGGNGLVYGMSVATSSTSAVAIGIHTADGTKAWQASLTAYNPYSPVVLSTNLICIPANNTGLIALDAATGIERWRNNALPSVSPATVDRSGHILVGASDGVHVLDAGNGKDLAIYSGTNASLPAVGQDGTVYYVRSTGSSSANGELVAANPTTHQAIWTAPNIEQGHPPIIGPNGAIFVIGSQSGTAFTRIVSFNAGTGAVLAELDNQFYSFSNDPAFGPDGNLYIGQGDKITAYSTGLVPLRQSTGVNANGNFYSMRRLTIGSDGTIYVVADQNSPDTDAKALAFNSADLSKKWEYDFTGRVLGNISVDSDGTVYYLTDSGKLTALR